MPESIKGQISIAVSNENAVQRLAEVEAAIKRVTEARKKDLEIARQAGGGGVSPAPSHPTARPSGGETAHHTPPYPGKQYDNSRFVPQGKEIETSTVSLEKFNGERLKQLQIQQQINRIGEANTTVRQIQEQVQANEGLVRVLTRRQSKMREGSKEYIEMSKHIDNLNKNIKKGGEEILKESIAAEKAKKAITGLSTEKQKNTKHTLAARLAAKLFHTEMGNGSLQMMKYGIIAAGVASAIKTVNVILELGYLKFKMYDKEIQHTLEQESRLTDYLKEKNKERVDFSQTLIDISQKKETERSADEMFRFSEAVDELRDSYKLLGIDIDNAIKNTYELIVAQGKLKDFQNKRIITQKKVEAEALERAIRNRERHNENAGFSAGQLLFGRFYNPKEGLLAHRFYSESTAARVLDNDEKNRRDRERIRQLLNEASVLEETNEEAKARKRNEYRKAVETRQAEQKLESTFASALKSLSAEIGKFRVTAQQAVEANSLEGIRLESRRFLNANLPEDKSLAHVQSLDANVKNLSANITSFGSKLDRLLNYTSNLTKLGGTITYG